MAYALGLAIVLIAVAVASSIVLYEKRRRNLIRIDAERFEMELSAALLYERHRTQERRFERPIDVPLVAPRD